jgi:hypothetical protein
MPAFPGRPREFTYQKRSELLDHISQGATIEEAARIVGISVRTVQREARHNEHFDHDLQLALHAAPVDPERLVRRAARTHWRAAAWLLERTDPDRFAKRPPNSCRPETMMDMSDWLIETALEATPPEHREAVYRRMRSVADKAFDVVMPDQHDTRRRLVGSLPQRPMPLSDHEYVKTVRVIGQPVAAPLPGASSEPAGRLPAAAPDGAVDAGPSARPGRPAGGESPTRAALLTSDAPAAPGSGPTAPPPSSVSTSVPHAQIVADPVSWYRRHPLPRSRPVGRRSAFIQGHRLQDSDTMDAASNYVSPEEDEAARSGAEFVAARRAVAAMARSVGSTADSRRPPLAPNPPNGGIMSPKMNGEKNRGSTP